MRTTHVSLTLLKDSAFNFIKFRGNSSYQRSKLNTPFAVEARFAVSRVSCFAFLVAVFTSGTQSAVVS